MAWEGGKAGWLVRLAIAIVPRYHGGGTEGSSRLPVLVEDPPELIHHCRPDLPESSRRLFHLKHA